MPISIPSTTVLSVPEARDLVSTQLPDDSLERIITREESWLTRRIGPLVGTFTQSIWVAPVDADTPLHLLRPTGTATVVDGGLSIDPTNIRLLGRGTIIEKALGFWMATTERQLGPVAVTYAPNDTDEVKRVLINLVQLTMADTGLQKEQIGQYSYEKATVATRERLARSLQPHRGPWAMRLRSSIKPDHIAGRTWVTWWQ